MHHVALIGFGLAGQSFHAPLIASVPELHLAAVVTSRADDVRARHPGASVHADVESVLTDPRIDLVVIATPNPTHGPLARAALEAGKHVVVDKPFALDVAESLGIEALAQARGRVLSVFHNRRWDADFLTVERLVRDGTLGDIALALFHWDRFRPAIKAGWREQPGAGSGLLSDLGPHLIDQAIRLFGAPEAVSADVQAQREGAATDDYFTVTLHYGSRRVILASASLVAEGRPRFALHGTRGSFVKHGIDPQEAHLRAGGSPDDTGYGVEAAEAYGVLTDAAGDRRPVASEVGDWRRFYRGMAEAMANGTAPPVEAADATAGLAVMARARRSAKEGSTFAFSVG